jgi:hypothetical protein
VGVVGTAQPRHRVGGLDGGVGTTLEQIEEALFLGQERLHEAVDPRHGAQR